MSDEPKLKLMDIVRLMLLDPARIDGIPDFLSLAATAIYDPEMRASGYNALVERTVRILFDDYIRLRVDEAKWLSAFPGDGWRKDIIDAIHANKLRARVDTMILRANTPPR